MSSAAHLQSALNADGIASNHCYFQKSDISLWEVRVNGEELQRTPNVPPKVQEQSSKLELNVCREIGDV